VRILYLDCFSGLAGDMILGALIDLGVDIEDLRKRLSSLPLRDYSITARRTSRQGISGTKFDVKVGRGHARRGWKEIRGIIDKSSLEKEISDPALKIFRRLIEVEAKVHQVPVDRVHLHEVGAVDAIVDIVGSVIALRHLLGESGQLWVSPLHVGRGMVTMEHGTFPVPAPATAELLKGIPIQSGPVEGELVTPTGAAIASTLATRFGPMPPMTLGQIGYGAGTRKYDDHPNMLRALMGEAAGLDETHEDVVVIESNIDDMNPQGFGYLMDKLFEDGALEVFYTPVQMKKNRPGTLVTVIVPQEKFGSVTATLFRESSTIGLRHTRASRIELAREIVPVKTKFGRIRVKVSSLDGSRTQVQPEYEDCRKIASSRKLPLKEVQAAALAAFRETQPGAAAPRSGRGRSSKKARRS
jgi:uncharacterized protein (TIGR00299 family) protein